MRFCGELTPHLFFSVKIFRIFCVTQGTPSGRYIYGSIFLQDATFLSSFSSHFVLGTFGSDYFIVLFGCMCSGVFVLSVFSYLTIHKWDYRTLVCMYCYVCVKAFTFLPSSVAGNLPCSYTISWGVFHWLIYPRRGVYYRKTAATRALSDIHTRAVIICLIICSFFW